MPKQTDYLDLIDENPTNTRIENLINIPAKKIIREGFNDTRKYRIYKTKKGLKRYYVLLNIDGKSEGLCSVDNEIEAINLHEKATKLYLNENLNFEEIKINLKNVISKIKVERFNKYGYPYITKSGNKFHGVYHINGKAHYTKAFDLPKEAYECCLLKKMELKNK